MTISSETRRAGPFTGDSSNTSFPFEFKVFDESDLRVVFTDADGVDADLVLDSDYSVSLNADQDADPGGTITYPISGAELAADELLTVVSDIPYTQETAITNGGAFYPQVVENALDKLLAQIQQVKEMLDRAPLVSVSSALASLVFPAPGAGEFIRWNAGGTALETASAVYDLGAFLQSGTGAVSRDANAKMAEDVSVTDFGAVGDGVTDDTTRILAAIAAIRGESVSILDTIGGNTITAYKSRELYFPPGVFVVEADALNFWQDIGLILRGAGSRGKTNYIHGATTLLVSGTSSGYGIRAYRNGGRSLTIMDMDICYATSGFTGSLIDVLDSPGLHLIRCHVGTYGITSGTRLQTAASLIRSTYDEFMTFDSCVFDGAVRGWWSDDSRTELANTFGGSVTTFNQCVFYDFSENHVYHGGTRTRQNVVFNNTAFNPISVSPSSSCVSMDNVEGIVFNGGAFEPSTTEAPASQWLRLTNATGRVNGVTFGDLAPAGLLAGKLDVSNNRIYCTSGFTLQSGIITGKGNEFSYGVSGWIINPTGTLCIDLGPDEFKAPVTNSYYIAADSALLSGCIRYCHDLDASSAKFTNASGRIKIENEDNKIISISATSYTVSIYDTGRTITATGSATQTFTLPTPVASTRLKFFKPVGQILNINCAGGTNFYRGTGAAMTAAQSAAADIGGYLELESYGVIGWKVVSEVGTWTYS